MSAADDAFAPLLEHVNGLVEVVLGDKSVPVVLERSLSRRAGLELAKGVLVDDGAVARLVD